MPSPAVAILLCSYNGATYLPEQLASFSAQTHTHWSLWVNDDGSTDATPLLIADYAMANPGRRVTQFEGPRQGFVPNFLNLAARPEIEAEYFSFSDQDDIWESDKLARAVAWLEAQPADVPALYCARTLYVTADNQPLYPSSLFARPLTFQNALVQSVAGANTMVFNRAARQLLVDSIPYADVVSHDWWFYLLVSGSGGNIHYDEKPCMRYRQHGNNVQGQNVSFKAKLARVKSLFAGNFRVWIDRNLHALAPLRDCLTPENQKRFDVFFAARQQTLLKRLAEFRKVGIYRQTPLGNLGLWIAALSNDL